MPAVALRWTSGRVAAVNGLKTNWAGMRCPYKLLRMILALVCTSAAQQYVPSICPAAPEQTATDRPKQSLTLKLNHGSVQPEGRLVKQEQRAPMSSEVGRAVWLRFSPPVPSSGPQPSFMAHLSGAVVGISMGLLILRSYEESLQKQCSWWVIVFSFITFLLFAIFWNIFAYELLGVQIPPPP
ncbi:hypothetical protein CCH79_00015621 [Gambusia affinis]|uniref:rhomboid protease n=1 Tax=Gambusia affinis TaxID=33528 RepID=A0A315VRK7_GAMAF|nr:hypothetical protein CCH79_00015621 [Gambusia affinis]